MPYIGPNYDPNAWIKKASEGFGRGLSRGIEYKMMKKEQDADEAKKKLEELEKFRAQMEAQGYKQEPLGPMQPGIDQSPIDKEITYGGMRLTKRLTPEEIATQEYTKLKREKELKEVPIMFWNANTGKPELVNLPEGYTNKTTKVITPPNVKQTETTEQKERAKAGTKANAELADIEAISKSAGNALNIALEANKNSYGGLLGKGIMGTKTALNQGANDQKYINTATVINIMKTQVIKDLKKTFGAQLSDAERDYLDTVYGAMDGMSQTQRDIAIKNVMTIFNDKVTAARAKAQALGANTPKATEVNDDPLGILK